MSATANPPSGQADPTQLTVLYTKNDDGWVTAQIAEFPAAISQGRTEHEAWKNVLDALHDLTHEPTATERLASLVQARIVEPLSGALEPLNELFHSFASAARDRRHERVH